MRRGDSAQPVIFYLRVNRALKQTPKMTGDVATTTLILSCAAALTSLVVLGVAINYMIQIHGRSESESQGEGNESAVKTEDSNVGSATDGAREGQKPGPSLEGTKYFLDIESGAWSMDLSDERG